MAKNKITIVLIFSIMVVAILTITACSITSQMAIPEVHAEIPATFYQNETDAITIGDYEPDSKAIMSFPTITPIPVSQATATPTALPLPANTNIFNTSESGSVDEIATTNFRSDTVFSIGYSVEGRELTMYRFGSGDSHRLIIAGIHGGYEYNTTDLAFELISYLEDNPDTIPEAITLYILPSLNPDGLALSKGYEGRANANGVDLNRNWDYDWKSTWNPDGCWAFLPITGGEGPFSEPETIALRDFIFDNNMSAIISYHSAALGIFAGGMPSHTISVPLAEAVSQVSPYVFPPVNTGCEITGQFIDYAASHGIPSLDIELANHRDTDFQINLRILDAFLNWH